jgi:hypothetical protein
MLHGPALHSGGLHPTAHRVLHSTTLHSTPHGVLHHLSSLHAAVFLLLCIPVWLIAVELRSRRLQRKARQWIKENPR